MDSSNFIQQVQNVYAKVWQAVDLLDPDIIEAEKQGDHITLLLLEGKYKFIVNRQTSVQQIWLAAGSEGFHFNYDEVKQVWLCDKTNREFFAVLEEKLYDYTQYKVTF